jgi:hypothetical protein
VCCAVQQRSVALPAAAPLQRAERGISTRTRRENKKREGMRGEEREKKKNWERRSEGEKREKNGGEGMCGEASIRGSVSDRSIEY